MDSPRAARSAVAAGLRAGGLSGRIQPGQAAKLRPRMADELHPYTIVVQSDRTGSLYRAKTDADGAYTATVPKELFPSTVYVKGGGTQTVTSYKIDITAFCRSGNAAIMFYYAKQ